MTPDELHRETNVLISEIGGKAPGSRHLHLTRLHDVMGAYSRSGTAAPASLRRLLDELTAEAVQARPGGMSL